METAFFRIANRRFQLLKSSVWVFLIIILAYFLSVFQLSYSALIS